MTSDGDRNDKRSFLHSADHRQRLVAIALVAMLAYGSMIAIDGLVMREWLDTSFGPTPDLHIYQEKIGRAHV